MIPEPPPIAIGTKIGPYEILGWLGAGGMGVVYRARDARLNRDVAIKLMPETFAADASRLRRFEQEARAAGQLNHPNIVAVYDVGTFAGAPYLVSELLEGESLRSRLHKGPLALRKAIDYARQIAEGLAAAHDKQIVHRDVKPDNLFITADGRIKILDFGIAKLTPRADSDGSLHTVGATQTDIGTVIGTAGYMSPEQVRGEAVDVRSDIFSFGAILHEMISGRPAFIRGTAPETMTAILKEDPSTPLPPDLSPALARIVARCLERTREMRFQSARDLAFALDVLSDSGATVAETGAASDAPRAARTALPWIAAGLLATALAAAAAWSLTSKASPPLAVTRFPLILPMPEGHSFASTGHTLAVSPDGSQIVYMATSRLFIRSMSELEVKTPQGIDSDEAMIEPVFSPDSRSIVFFAPGDQMLKRMPVEGGAAVTICPADRPLGISWGLDGIVFGQGSRGILRAPSSGGTVEVIARVKDGELAQGPQILPGGRHVLFTVATGTGPDRWDKAHIVVQTLKSEERKTLIEGGTDARYVPTGHIVYAVSGRLFAVAFDPERLAIKGHGVPIVDGVSRAATNSTGAAHFSFSSTGSLVYLPGPAVASSKQLALIDRHGAIEPLKLQPGPYQAPRMSPDRKRIVFGTDDGKEAIVWVYDLSGASTMQRLTTGGNSRFPIWTADSKRIVFQSDREGDLAIFWQAADGTGAAERLTTPAPGESHVPDSWSPRSATLLFDVKQGEAVSLWAFSLTERTSAPFGAVRSSNSVGTAAAFSPDGRWVAYTSREPDRARISVQPYPATGAVRQLFAKGPDDPHHPVWSPDGKMLFYVPRPSGFESVRVTTQPTLTFGNPEPLSVPFELGPPGVRRAFDMTPDGKFLGLILGAGGQMGAGLSPQVQVVLNWFEELKTRVPR
jgi:eukaryotic-like serine/threonine-protein kinase